MSTEPDYVNVTIEFGGQPKLSVTSMAWHVQSEGDATGMAIARALLGMNRVAFDFEAGETVLHSLVSHLAKDKEVGKPWMAKLAAKLYPPDDCRDFDEWLDKQFS